MPPEGDPIDMTLQIRVRFAPSPTGEPHVGNIRTAIFNWLFARHSQGTFIIRVEDTDQARVVEGATEDLLESLRWLGVDWDEGPVAGGQYGPYFQSQRLDHYQQAADYLVGAGNAYHCYCSPERLEEMRKEQTRQKQPTGYDKRCRNLAEDERVELARGDVTPVVRFKMPLDGTTEFRDLIRDSVSFENRLIDDFVMLKSDGFPTYHLANVVDDHLMEISHVLRAEEWLPSTPRHLQMYSALGWEPPLYAHLPIILAPDKSKLSKRHGATSVLEYRRMGYLPAAMTNFLTLLGWSLDDKTEVMSDQELVGSFTIDRVGKSGAVFSSEKLEWMNGVYMRQMSHEELADALLDYWGAFPPEELDQTPDRDFLQRMVPLIQERMKVLADAAPLIAFFFKDEIEYDGQELVQKGMDAAGARRGLEASLQRLSDLPDFDAGSIEAALRPLADELNVKTGALFGSLRVATTGQRVAPPLFQTMEVLGRDRTLSAVSGAIQKLDRG